MRFVVTRTSCFCDETSPCVGAFHIDGVSVDERTVDHPDKNKHIGSEHWYGTGVNHRVENGHIKRDFPTKAWAVDIVSIEEMMEFIKENGQVIIRGESNSFAGFPNIEIYDDYRE